MAKEEVRWWSMRPAQNLKGSAYTCPFCGNRLASMSPHALIAPEDDRSRRRHAHMECVQRARAAGKLPTRDEWRRAERGPRPSLGERLRGLFAGKGSAS
jgi:hypothetical protein